MRGDQGAHQVGAGIFAASRDLRDEVRSQLSEGAFDFVGYRHPGQSVVGLDYFVGPNF